jgi:organic hydroperoxide reductase OsmC/OhrA
MNGQHTYNLRVEWTGNRGVGTSNYKVYERSHTIIVDNKPDILASADPAFRGDKTKHNPEDLLVASLSACHMLRTCIYVQCQALSLRIILTMQQEL